MPDNLLRPDNRSLGWSTGDLSLYGAQPGTTVTVARASEPAPLPPSTQTSAPSAAPAPSSSNADAFALAPLDLRAADEAAPSAAPPTVAPIPSIADASAGNAATDPAPIATPTGGSTPPGILVSTVAPDHGPDGSRVGNGDQATLAGGTATAVVGAVDLLGHHAFVSGTPVLDLASSAVGGLGGIVTATETTLGNQIAGVVDVLDGLSSAVSETALAVGDNLAGAVGALDAGVGDLGNSLPTTVGATVADAGALVGDATAGLLDAVGSAATTLPGDMAAVQAIAGATDVAGGVVQDVGAAVPVLGDDLPLAGADPAGGVATLVDLVQTSELFVVGQSDVAPDPAAAGGSIVDSLIGDTAVPDLAHHDDADHHAPATNLVDGLHLGF